MDLEELKQSLTQNAPHESQLWNGQYKIPWDDPDFSGRMIKEHLTQDHDLASRKSEMIIRQTKWIFDNISLKKPGKLLDIACGPGFYINNFTNHGYRCKAFLYHCGMVHSRNDSILAQEYDCRI